MKSAESHLSLKARRKHWKSGIMAERVLKQEKVRKPMLELGRKLIKNKIYPSKSLVRKVAAVLATRILGERN